MLVRTSEGSPAAKPPSYPAGLPVIPPLSLPTRTEAREQAQVAVAVGLGLVVFGLLVLLLLP
jgi:hypothetical protein